MSNDDLKEFFESVGTDLCKHPKEKTLKESCGVETPPDLCSPKKGNSNAKMWAVNGSSYFPCERSVSELPPNLYNIGFSPESGIYFSESLVKFDELIHLPDTESEFVINEIQDFESKEQHFRNLGFLWKRGFLLYGPPGSGKTSCIHLVGRQLIKNGNIGIFVSNPDLATKSLDMLRRVEPERLLIVILEDLDAIIREHGESSLLALMDGETQIDNVIYIATTNYPERLDPRIINRPSRFDLIKKIGMPSAAAREAFLKHKYPKICKDPEEYEKWIKKTEGFSIAHLKEVIVSIEVFSRPFNEVIDRLEKMIQKRPDSSDYLDREFMGFKQ